MRFSAFGTREVSLLLIFLISILQTVRISSAFKWKKIKNSFISLYYGLLAYGPIVNTKIITAVGKLGFFFFYHKIIIRYHFVYSPGYVFSDARVICFGHYKAFKII